MSANGDDDSGDPPEDRQQTGEGDGDGDGAGHTSGRTELSIEDVRFLRAVRDISADPDDYPRTGQGVTPATVSAIREVTNLSRSQLNYRMGVGANQRGFEEMGLVVTHDPPMTDTGYGKRSVELTERGERRLEQGLQAYGLAGGSGRADQEVMEQLEDLGSQLESLERRLDTIERDVEEAGRNRQRERDFEKWGQERREEEV